MLESEFWRLADLVFGPEYARTLVREMALTGLDSRTGAAALHEGIAPRDVWHALCDAMEISPVRRDGGDHARLVPPPR